MKNSFEEKLNTLGKEIFDAIHEALMSLTENRYVLPKTITLYTDDCNNGDLYSLPVKTIVLKDSKVFFFAELEEDVINHILHDKDAYFEPDECWIEGGEWYAEWEGLAQIADAVIEHQNTITSSAIERWWAKTGCWYRQSASNIPYHGESDYKSRTDVWWNSLSDSQKKTLFAEYFDD